MGDIMIELKWRTENEKMRYKLKKNYDIFISNVENKKILDGLVEKLTKEYNWIKDDETAIIAWFIILFLIKKDKITKNQIKKMKKKIKQCSKYDPAKDCFAEENKICYTNVDKIIFEIFFKIDPTVFRKVCEETLENVNLKYFIVSFIKLK